MQEFIDILCGWSLYGPAVQGALMALAGGAAGGVLGNRADWLACKALGPAWKKLQGLRATDPELNHELQRAAREAYLRATLELLEHAGAARPLRKRVQQEIDGVANWLPDAPLGDLDALLLDDQQPEGTRAHGFRAKLGELLLDDLERWQPGSSRDQSIAARLAHGWTIQGPGGQTVTREWQGVISLNFVAQLKAKQPLANIFQAQMLARMHAEEPRIPADFQTFISKLDEILEAVHDVPARVADELARRNMVRPERRAILEERPPAFTGRAAELDKLRTALAVPGARILVHGHPGSGKSTLALWFGWQEDERGASVVFLPCGRRPLAQAVAEFAPKLGIDSKLAPEQQIEEMHRWLREREALLILDDVWEDPQKVLPPAPARVLITSRSRDTAHLPPQCRMLVGGFTPEEAEAFWAEALGVEWMPRHGPALMGFAQRADYLPYALAVAASLLSLTSKPAGDALAGLTVSTLHDGKFDLAKLLAEAVAAQSPPGQELLRSFGVCAAEGVWLPFATEIAGLDPGVADAEADRLVNASLLRLLDREERRFAVHPLLHEWLEGEQDSGRRSRHAAILSRRFETWEAEWRDCARLLAEVDAALAGLRKADEWPSFSALSFQAFALGLRTGSLEAALRFQKAAQSWAEDRSDQAGLQSSLGNQGGILRAWGKLDDAMALVKEQERICRDLGDQAGLSASQANQALILHAWGRLDEAMALHKEGERICRELGDQAGLHTSLGNQAVILQAWGKLDEAMALHKEQERICRDLGDQAGLSASKANQALILHTWGKLDEAMALHKEQERICRDLGDQAGLSASKANQALILRAWGKLDEAMALLKEQERICGTLGDQAGLQASLGNQAVILLAWGKLDEAMALHKEEERICRALGDQAGLSRSSGNQALILQALGKLDEAMALQKEVERMSRALGDLAGSQASLGNQALILRSWGRLDEAMALLKEQERICRALDDQTGLRASLGNQAVVLQSWGKLDEAMALHEETERICRALGDQAGLATSLANQGVVFHKRGNLPEARKRITEAHQIFTALGMPRERDLMRANLDKLPAR